MSSKRKPSAIDDLQKNLTDNLWVNNSEMARFVLARLVELRRGPRESEDLWKRNEKKDFVWTVEHIFPQGETIPPDWVDMIASGDKERAMEIREEYVHCLGNLTLSGYNPKLGNAGFKKKQNHQDKNGHYIGYKNGLPLNDLRFSVHGQEPSLAEIESWSEDSIIARNNAMVDILVKEFAFDEAEFTDWEKKKSTASQ